LEDSKLFNPVENGQVLQILPLPHLTTQTRTTTATSAQSAAFNANTSKVRLVASQDCFVVAGADPTAASATGVQIIANRPEVFGVIPGQKIAAIRSTADGVLRIEEF
jgi:hypothetical protein